MLISTSPRPADASKFGEDEVIERALARYYRDVREEGVRYDVPSPACCTLTSGIVHICNAYRTLASYRLTPRGRLWRLSAGSPS
jgi:hypothetical protein